MSEGAGGAVRGVEGGSSKPAGGTAAHQPDVYAPPRVVESLDDCHFYHTMDIPGHGTVKGTFDLRGNERKYLGGVDFRGKRVLEVGTASGFLCFHMEQQGADVVAYDLSEDAVWDVVPFAGFDYDRVERELRPGTRRLNNAWWFCHRAFESKARVAYGSVYDIPAAIGPVDYTTFCAVLIHFQNPFKALHTASRLTKEKIIVTEVLGRFGKRSLIPYLLNPFKRPKAKFLPDWRRVPRWKAVDDATKAEYLHECLGWWLLTPKIVREFLGVLGFGKSKVTYHLQKWEGKRLLGFTVVGERTVPLA